MEKVSRLYPRSDSEAAADRQPRKLVKLQGYAALEDGTTFAISVLDLSYDGCKVETELALLPGLSMKISMLGLGSALNAVVRWSRDGKAGLKFTTEEAPEVSHKPRKEERLLLQTSALLRRAGRESYQARVFDLNRTGCKVEFIERPKAGELLWTKFGGLEPVQATVRWVDGFYGGLEFVRPIYPAVFDLLLAKLRG